jgi:quinol monooxygenase YgiN
VKPNATFTNPPGTPGVWFVHENWLSSEGLDSHMKTTHLQAFLEMVPALVDGVIELQRFTMTSIPAAPRV